MALGWFKKTKDDAESPRSMPGTTAVVSEMMPVAAPVADLEPAPATTLPTEPQTPPAAMEIPPEKIAALAYEIWVEKGRPPGTEQQNWLEAEAELRIQSAANPGPEPRNRKPR